MVNFFSKSPAATVWKSVTGVSAAGRKRGRGKGTGRAIVKDFNRGQEIGVGRERIILPGLNAPVISANRYTNIQDGGENLDFKAKLDTVRKEMNVYRKFREAPLERGWSGRRAHGRSAGQPDDYNETSFEGFKSTCLMLRPLMGMSGTLGRTKRMGALVVTGNGNGLAGFAYCISNDGRSAVRHARNKATQYLIQVPRWENHTVMHDFFSKYYQTTVFVRREPKGFGLRAQRVIKAICEAFGITDINAKIEGSTENRINITKAFFLGLMNQRKYEDMAEEKQLHLVDLREENYYYPNVLASPSSRVRLDEEIKAENLDFTYYINNGKIKQVKAKGKVPFVDHPEYYKYLYKLDLTKNREMTKLQLAAKYGDTKVKDVFPYFRSNADSFNKPKEQETDQM